jgi:hypothetical protein
VSTCPLVDGVPVTATPLTLATVGPGYVPDRSPLADPVGVREFVRRESLPAAKVPAVVPAAGAGGVPCVWSPRAYVMAAPAAEACP